ncbi:MAG: hypothetical protein HY001_01130 [Candidatus Portnoybacteria bacterium]|nr:hypothetical protein [Candidatus Portnoybacteria bacterium]
MVGFFMSLEAVIGVEEEQQTFQENESRFEALPIKELRDDAEFLRLCEERDKEITKLLESQQEESKQLQEKREQEKFDSVVSACEEQLKSQLGSSQLDVISGWQISTIVEARDGRTYFQDEEGKRTGFKDDTGTRFSVKEVSIEEDFRGKEYGGSIKIHLRTYEDAYGNKIHEFKEQTYRPPEEKCTYESADTDYPTLHEEEPVEVPQIKDEGLLPDKIQPPQEQKISIFGFAQAEVQALAKEKVPLFNTEPVQKNTSFDKKFAPVQEVQKKPAEVEKDKVHPFLEKVKHAPDVFREKKEDQKYKTEKKEITHIQQKEAALSIQIPEVQSQVENAATVVSQEPVMVKTMDVSTINTVERAFPEVGRVEVTPSLPDSPSPEQGLSWGSQSLNELLDQKLVETIEATIQEYTEQPENRRILIAEMPTPQEPIGGAIIIEPTEHGSFEVSLRVRPEPTIVPVDIFTAPETSPHTSNLSTKEYKQTLPLIPDYSPTAPVSEKTETVQPPVEGSEETRPLEVVSESTLEDTENHVEEVVFEEGKIQEKVEETEVNEISEEEYVDNESIIETETQASEGIVMSQTSSVENSARERIADKELASQEINESVEDVGERQPFIIRLAPFVSSRQSTVLADDADGSARSRQSAGAARAFNQAA